MLRCPQAMLSVKTERIAKENKLRGKIIMVLIPYHTTEEIVRYNSLEGRGLTLNCNVHGKVNLFR